MAMNWPAANWQSAWSLATTAEAAGAALVICTERLAQLLEPPPALFVQICGMIVTESPEAGEPVTAMPTIVPVNGIRIAATSAVSGRPNGAGALPPPLFAAGSAMAKGMAITLCCIVGIGGSFENSVGCAALWSVDTGNRNEEIETRRKAVVAVSR